MLISTDLFLAEEWKILSESLALINAQERRIENCIEVSMLLDHERCEKLLFELTPVIHSPSIKITASLLSKRYAFLATASSLYAMTVFNKGIDFSADNCFLDFSFEQRLWRSKMPVKDLSYSLPHDHRAQWREDIVKKIFADNLAQVWQVFVDVSKVNPRILWENTAVRVFSLYEKRIQKINNCAVQRNLQEDFRYLLEQAPPEVFGLSDNPLKRFNFKKIRVVETDEEVRYRKSCCFYYKASDPVEYCSTCPLVHPDIKKRKVKNV
ncbi:IucA/IucC family C-terminal-domain containing protein [Acinetobacter sp. ESBL14]|uniref:IucA/IucC family C-terminal-domain containing protein n=1 Tax=Acinetobacter sp. ESBL14 TaxID=3077329 RepID=UPI002FCA8592